MSNEEKKNRSYRLIVESLSGDSLIIEYPFTLDFTVTRKSSFSNNTASFSIYNLGNHARNQIRKTHYDLGLFRKLTFLAGYNGNYSTIFHGDITLAYSERNGVDFMTNIECLDSGYALSNSQTSKTYTKGTPYRTIVRDLLENIQGIEVGAIGDIKGQLARSASFSGNTGEIVNQLTNNKLFIDNGRAFVMGDDDILSESEAFIDSESGLLAPPRVEGDYVSFEMIFEPKLFLGQKITLESSTFSGEFRVDSITHKGIISEAVSGRATTKVGCMYGEAWRKLRMEMGLYG